MGTSELYRAIPHPPPPHPTSGGGRGAPEEESPWSPPLPRSEFPEAWVTHFVGFQYYLQYAKCTRLSYKPEGGYIYSQND